VICHACHAGRRLEIWQELQEEVDHKMYRIYQHPSCFGNVDGIIHFAGTTKEFLGFIKNLPVKEGDVFIATYPKSGI